ncbi:MAG: DUF3606 domain-containing protein [Mesorhizobium sp.]|nr:MAG: DUF3606 domain-containing protein [Mesorhizobium sp.]TKB35933.1 MAG: DUF3606 domain-containing protein [Mesorhizobium sp.]
MATPQTTRGRSQDRAKVVGSQDHEVKYEAGKTGASKDEVKSAVKSVGNSRNIEPEGGFATRRASPEMSLVIT